jgi:hypothetical protein
LVATARSAIVASSVSPERWLRDRAVAVAHREVDRLEGLAERADLVHLDEDRVGALLLEALLQELLVGDEEVVADELDLVAELGGELGFQPSQSFSARPSSIERIGYLLHQLAHMSIISSLLRRLPWCS